MKTILLNKSGTWVVVPHALQALVPLAFQDFSPAVLEYARMVADQGRESGPIIVDGVQVITISGLLVADVEPWEEQAYKLCNPHRIRREVAAAVQNESVRGILLPVDSPGGYSKGINTLSHAIGQASEQKPIVAFCDGAMCSGAYWIGSAASKIVAEPTSESGSIGAYLTHYEYSVMMANLGITGTVIKAGEEKAVGNPIEPLDEKAKAVLQKRIDNTNDLFIAAVAANRGVAKETVAKDMAEGRVFGAEEARQVGLIDQVGTYDDAVQLLHSLMRNEEMDGEKTKTKVAATGVSFAMAAKLTAIVGADPSTPIETLEAKGISAAQVAEVFDAFGIETLATCKKADQQKVEEPKVEEETKPGEAEVKQTEAEKMVADAKAMLLQVSERLAGAPIGAQAPKTEAVTGENYMEQVKALAAREGITMTAAQGKIDNEYPDARNEYLVLANKNKERRQ